MTCLLVTGGENRKEEVQNAHVSLLTLPTSKRQHFTYLPSMARQKTHPGAVRPRSHSLAASPLQAQVSWRGHRQEETFHSLVSHPADR